MSKCPALTSVACALVVFLNNGIIYIAYHFEPDWDPENIHEEDCTEPVPRDGMFLACCCLILLDMLLFVNATASVSFYYAV